MRQYIYTMYVYTIYNIIYSNRKITGELSSYWRCAIKTIPETGTNRSGGLKLIVVCVCARARETFSFWWLTGSIFHRLRVSFKDHRKDPFPCWLFLSLMLVPPPIHHQIIDNILKIDHPLLLPNTIKLINNTITP